MNLLQLKPSLLTLLIPLFLSSCANGQAVEPALLLSQEDTAFIDTLFEPFSGEVPGAAVIISHKSKMVLCKGYGMSNMEKMEAVTCDTNFMLASTSKQFTAMAVLVVIHQGKLSLHDTLQDIFPDFPDYGKSITVQHLLTHTSGLRSYSLLESAFVGRFMTDSDILNYLTTLDKAEFPAGSKYQYSNTAYAVLTEIVAEVSQTSFTAFMQEHIFKPANMEGTFYLETSPNNIDRALGYDMSKDTPRYEEDKPSSRVKGDGAIYTSARGMFGWHSALREKSLTSNALHDAAYTAQPGTNGSYGYGWFLNPEQTGRIVEHGGSGLGFISYTIKDIDADLTVTILANRSRVWPNVPGTDIYARAYALLSLATNGIRPMPTMEELGLTETAP